MADTEKITNDLLGDCINKRMEEWKKGTIVTEQENLNLPVPRLEIRYFRSQEGNYNLVAVYSLIYKHLLGNTISLPFSSTKVGKGSGTPVNDDGTLDTPVRDGSHIQNEKEQLNIPAYVIFNEKYQII